MLPYFFWGAWILFFSLMVPNWCLGERFMAAALPHGTWKRAWYYGSLIFAIIVMGLTFMPVFEVSFP